MGKSSRLDDLRPQPVADPNRPQEGDPRTDGLDPKSEVGRLGKKPL
jgi:hypothetical protein